MRFLEPRLPKNLISTSLVNDPRPPKSLCCDPVVCSNGSPMGPPIGNPAIRFSSRRNVQGLKLVGPRDDGAQGHAKELVDGGIILGSFGPWDSQSHEPCQVQAVFVHQERFIDKRFQVLFEVFVVAENLARYLECLFGLARQTGGKTGDPKRGTRSTKPCQHEQAHFCALEPLRQAAVVAPQPDGCTCVKGELPYYKQRQSTYLTLLDMWCYSVQYIGVTT